MAPMALFSRLPIPNMLEAKPISAIVAVLGIYVLGRVYSVLRMIRTPLPFPQVYSAFAPFALPGVLFPTTWWTAGYSWHWDRRHETYKRGETVNLVPLISGVPGLWTSNIDIARQVVVGAHKSKFYKPEPASRAFLLWGMNLVASDGSMWRKHRRIVGPAFNVELYKLVWTQSAQAYREMLLADKWEGENTVDIPTIQSMTMKFAFQVISTCGFGFPSTWAEPVKSGDGEMPVQEALQVAAEHHLLMITVPRWLLHFPVRKFARIRQARDRLISFMHGQVAERKADVASGNALRSDAFTMLVKANQDESSKYQLSDDELIGNVFLFMFAGHETTAHTLAGTLGFMAIHQDVQEEVLQQILEVVGRDRDPQFEDYGQLDKVLAIFYEAARMFPAGHVLIREASEDTILTVPNPVGEEGSTSVPISKGTTITVDMIGVQYNPRYCESPESYRPSRWYGLPTDSEIFTAFSVGPRACIGRRFATIEAVCFLSLLLRDWKVVPILKEGESTQAWGERVMDAKIVLTLGVRDIPLRFERRK